MSAPTKTCPKCHTKYDLTETFTYDNWNVGHYGCTEGTPMHSGWKDEGCPNCRTEAMKIDQKLSLLYAQTKDLEEFVQRCYDDKIEDSVILKFLRRTM